MHLPFEREWHEGQTYTPKGIETAKKLKELGIESPKGKMIKKDNRAWIIKRDK